MTQTLCAMELGQSLESGWLFRGVDLQCRPGTLTVVVGRNGAGKSTLLRYLCGLDPKIDEGVREGRVELGGTPVRALGARQRAQALAFLPQSTPLYQDLQVRELVSLGRGPHLGRFGRPGPRDVDAVDAALERVGLGGLATRSTATLSGGERQRCMLARMLATGAPILIMDEPCTSLDVAHALGFLELCRALCEDGSTIVVAMHELELAARHADELVCLGLPDGGWLAGDRDAVFQPEIVRAAFGVDLHPTGMGFRLPQ